MSEPFDEAQCRHAQKTLLKTGVKLAPDLSNVSVMIRGHSEVAMEFVIRIKKDVESEIFKPFDSVECQRIIKVLGDRIREVIPDIQVYVADVEHTAGLMQSRLRIEKLGEDSVDS
jgi:hypothetical protein